MTVRNLRTAAIGAAMALMAAPSVAQQPAAPAAAGPTVQVLPGVCVYASNQALGRSKVGSYVLQRLDTIAGQANAEINGQRNQLQTDVTSLNTQVQTPGAIPQAQAEQRALELRQREQALVQLMQVRQREVDLTEGKAFERISNEVRPLLEQTLREKGCSILLEQQATIYYIPNYDITADVITKLDAKIVEFAFDRERLDQQPAAPTGVQAPAGAPGRAGPPTPPRGGAAPAAGRGGRGN